MVNLINYYKTSKATLVIFENIKLHWYKELNFVFKVCKQYNNQKENLKSNCKHMKQTYNGFNVTFIRTCIFVVLF